MWFLTKIGHVYCKLPYAAHKLSDENLKLRQKLEEVAGRCDYYARLDYEALA